MSSKLSTLKIVWQRDKDKPSIRAAFILANPKGKVIKKDVISIRGSIGKSPEFTSGIFVLNEIFKNLELRKKVKVFVPDRDLVRIILPKTNWERVLNEYQKYKHHKKLIQATQEWLLGKSLLLNSHGDSKISTATALDCEHKKLQDAWALLEQRGTRKNAAEKKRTHPYMRNEEPEPDAEEEYAYVI